MALPPPWTPAGKGSKGWVHRATEVVLPNPGEGSESSVRDKQRDRVALWTEQSGAQFPPCRDPPLSPTPPPPPPRATRQAHYNKTNTPQPRTTRPDGHA